MRTYIVSVVDAHRNVAMARVELCLLNSEFVRASAGDKPTAMNDDNCRASMVRCIFKNQYLQ